MPILNYIKEVRAELKHVTWPTRMQTVLYTVIVVLVSIGTAVYLGIFDYFFSLILKQII
jgi:preprotein translocase subunit SecE